MTDTAGPTTSRAGIWTPPPDARRLERPRSPRVLGGVCSGLGRYTNLDPVLFRVVVAVLAVTGAGLLLYVAAYLTMPEEGEEASPLESLLGHGRSSANPPGTVLIGILALLSLLWVGFSHGAGIALTVAAVVGLVLLLRRDGHPMPWQQSGSSQATAPYAPHGPYAPPAAEPGEHATATAPQANPAEQPTATFPTYGPWQPEPVASPPVVGHRTTVQIGNRGFSWLGLVTGFLAVVSGAVVIGADRLGWLHGTATEVLAVPLAVIGAGVLLSSVVGRAHGMIGLGLLLVLGLVVVQALSISSLHDIRHSVRDKTYQPTTLAQVQRRYDVGIGDTRIDLGRVDFTGTSTDIQVSAGIGNTRIIVPAGVDVTVDAHSGLGDLSVFGQHVSRHRSMQTTSTAAGAGTLDLEIDGGIGDVEVSRA